MKFDTVACAKCGSVLAVTEYKEPSGEVVAMARPCDLCRTAACRRAVAESDLVRAHQAIGEAIKTLQAEAWGGKR